MTDNKLTDEQIVKALECCMNGACEECPMPSVGVCSKTDFEKLTLQKHIAELKAEVERLQNKIKEVTENCTFVMRENDKANNKRFLEAIEVVKSEARKEFAERFKEKYRGFGKHTLFSRDNLLKGIDNLLKEMEGE